MATVTQIDTTSNFVRGLDQQINTAPALRGWLWDVILLLLPSIGLSPLLVLHGVQLWGRPSFQFYPVALICLALGLLFSEKAVSTSRMRRRGALVVAIIASIMAIYSAWIFSPSIACGAIALFVVAWALVRLIYGSSMRSILWGMLVAILIPLPMNLDVKIENDLNSLVATFTSRILDTFQTYHLLQAPYLAVEKQTINYLEYLANPFSLRSILALVLVFVIARHRAFLSGVLAACTAILCTLIGKIFLLTVAVLMVNGGFSWNEGWLWTLLLLLIALVAVILTSMFESFWGAALAPIRTAGEVVAIDRSKSANIYNRIAYWPGSIIRQRTRVGPSQASLPFVVGSTPSLILIILCLAVGVLAAPLAIAVQKQKLLFYPSNEVELLTDRLPEEKTIAANLIPGLRLNQYQTNVGRAGLGRTHVFLWSFSGIDTDAKIAMVYPVDGWRKKWSLGEGDAWNEVENRPESLQAEWPFLEELGSIGEESKITNRKFFSCQLTMAGEPYTPTAQELVDVQQVVTTNRWTESKLINYLKMEPQPKLGSSIVVQMQFDSKQPLRVEEVDLLRSIFESIRVTLLQKLKGSQ